MKSNLYTPFGISVSIYLASLIITFVMNEPDHTNDHQQYTTVFEQEYSTFISEEPVPHLIATTSPALAPNKSQLSKIRKLAKFQIQPIVDLFHSPTSHFCLLTFVVKRVAFASENFVFQYASERFLWPLHQTTYLRVATASGAIFATLVACPLSFSVLGRRGFAAHKLDLNAVRISLMIVVLSFFYAWEANTGFKLALGTLEEIRLVGYGLMLIMNHSDDRLWARWRDRARSTRPCHFSHWL